MRIADSRKTTNLTCEQARAQMEQPRRAVQSVEGMARTLRLDLLGRTNIAVAVVCRSHRWMVRHAAMVAESFQTGSADGKTACAQQFERPYESPVPPFAERVMWKDPTLQPAKLKSSWGYDLWLGNPG